MTLLDIIRSNLRITSRDFDYELEDLIDQAVSDLKASGVNPDAFNTPFTDISDPDIIITDANLRRAVILYCKAYFGIDNSDKEWFSNQYHLKKAEILNQITQYVSTGDTSV